MRSSPPPPGFAALFTPKFVTVLREGYGLAALRADAVAGLTVAIVALPLSMAIAIASGVSPDRGLYTAIVGGLLISLLGGSRFQIGGPAGAFIVLVAGTVATQGVDGLLIATLLSGVILVAAGFLRLGNGLQLGQQRAGLRACQGEAQQVFELAGEDDRRNARRESRPVARQNTRARSSASHSVGLCAMSFPWRGRACLIRCGSRAGWSKHIPIVINKWWPENNFAALAALQKPGC